jgi:RNA polymerase sigma factor (sigma-70 family)
MFPERGIEMPAWEKLTPAVDRAAGIAKSNFPAHHDMDDVRQTLWVWVFETKNTVTRILDDPDSTPTAIVSLLVRAASEHLKKEDAAVYGYAEEDKFFYSIDQIKSILEVIFTHEDWQSFASAIDPQPKAKSNPAQGGNNLASYADVSRVVKELSEDYYNLIVWRYKYRNTFEEMGRLTRTDRSSVRQRHDRALKALQKLLGEKSLGELRGGHDGRTEARGSIDGQVRVERDYEG